jgi:hypothetical protein
MAKSMPRKANIWCYELKEIRCTVTYHRIGVTYFEFFESACIKKDIWNNRSEFL